jgi:hypothetical protein
VSLFSGGENETFEVILSARDAGLTSTLRNADSHIDATAERVKRLGEAFLIFEGLRKSIDLVKDFGKAAANQQADLAQVNVALKDNGQSVRAWGQATADALKKRAAATGFALSDETQSFVKLEGATHNNAEALKLLGVAQDVSRARHVALTGVSLALAKGVQGNTTSLARYGIIIPKITTVEDQLKVKHNELTGAHIKQTAALKDAYAAAMAQAKAQDKQATSAKVVAEVQKLNAGAADAYGKSLSGQADRTKVSIDELEATIGRKLIPTERAALQQVSSWVDELQHSNRVQSDATQFAHGLAVAWDDTVAVLRTVGPPLLEIANDTSKVVQAMGGIGTVLAFGAAWYSTAKSVSLGATALQSLSTFATPGALAAKRAAAVSGEAGAAASVALTAPEAMAAGGSAWAGLGGVSRGASTATNEIGGAERAITRIEGAAAKAGPSIAGFGAGLAEAFNPVAAATIGVGLLAGGLYYLSTEESNAERAAKRTGSAFDLLTSSAAKFRQSGQNLQGDRINTSGDKLARQQAALAIQQALAVKNDPSQNTDLLQRKQNILALAQAYQAWRVANHNVAGDLALTKDDVKQQGEAANGTQVAISRLAHSLISQANAAKEGVDPLHTLAGAHGGVATSVSSEQRATDKARAALDAFTASTSSHAAALAKSNPALSHATTLLGEFASAQQRTPTKAEVTFILQHAKTDDDLKTITSKVKAFDGKKVQSELQLQGVPQIVGDIGHVRQLLQGLTNTPWVIPISYSTGPAPVKPASAGGHPNTPGGASGMRISGAYGADDTPIWVTGGEVVMNPTQIGLVNAGWSVGGALAATGAPTIRRGGSYSGGGNAVSSYGSAADAAISNAPRKPPKKPPHAGHGKAAQTPEQLAEAAFQANATSFTNSIGGLLAAYAQDQLNATKKTPLTRDLHQLIAKFSSRASTLTALRGDKRFRGYPGAVAAINQELASDFGNVGTYRSDLQTLLAPGTVAPGGIAFQKSLAGLNLSLHSDQAQAADKKHPGKAAAAAKRIKLDRQRIANAYQGRINVLRALRRKPPRGMLGAILDGLDTDQQALGTVYSDQSTDDTNPQTAQDIASLLAAAAAAPLNNDYFLGQENAINERIAADQAALSAGQVGSPALTQDTQALFDLVTGRVATLQGILASPYGSPAYRSSVTDELTQDFGVLASITQGSTGAGGSVAASAAPTADEQAIIAQLQSQLAIQTRASGLSDAALRVFGGSGDIGSGGYANAWGAAQGPGQTINVYTLHPGDPQTLGAIADASNAGNGLQPSISSSRTAVNL